MGGLVEKPDEKEKRYRVTQKGEEFLVNPPPPEEIKKEKPATAPSAAPSVTPSAAPSAAPTTTPTTTPTTPDKEDIAIPSQADTLRSIAEQLSISKAEEAKGGDERVGEKVDGKVFSRTASS